jgi:hypothetical protein
VKFGTVEETIESRLIVLPQGTPKWCPGTTFGLDELAEGRQRSPHTFSPPFIRALRRLEIPMMSLETSRLDQLHVTAPFNPGNADT